MYCLKKAALVILIYAEVCSAQVTTATLSAIVTDPSGAVVPGVEVNLTNEGTGAVLRKATGAAGECVFNFIPPGSYTVRIEAPGFKTLEQTHMELGAAQNVRRNFTLDVGEMTERVTVTAEAALVNPVSAEQLESFSGWRVQDLPLSKRNFSAVLASGAGITRNEGQGRVRLNGLGAGGTRITADGTQASGDPASQGVSVYQQYNRIDIMSIEAIGEAQVIKGVIPAEYGEALGGNVNLITRSGTNAWHGSLFYNYQGSALSARLQFAQKKPNFVWNQFGGSLTGPIVPNRAFFLFAEEVYRESNAQILNANVPTLDFRSKMLTSLPFPETKLFLDAVPLPNQPHNPSAITGYWQGPGRLTARDNHIDLKGDVLVGPGGTFSVTYIRGRPFQEQARVSPQNPRAWTGTNERLTANYVIGGAQWTSETRFGINYSNMDRTDGFFDVTDPNKDETIFGGRRVATINCCGMIGLGDESNIRGRRPHYDFSHKYAYITAKHSLKFGGSYYRRGMGRIDVENPVVRFESATDLLANNPSRITATLGVNPYASRVWWVGLFAQDDWRLTPKLVLNLGIRYDYFSNFRAWPTSDAGAGWYNPDGLLDNNFNFGPLREVLNPIKPDAMNFGPRFGFAYNPDGKGLSVIRGGFGVMFSPLDYAIFDNAVGTSPTIPFRVQISKQEAQAFGLRWPVYNEDVLDAIGDGGGINVYAAADPNIQAPYAMNIYLGIQQKLTASMMVESAFVSTRGVKFTLQRNANQIDRFTGLRPNPNLGEPKYFDNSQQTFYASWQTSLRRRLASNLSFAAHYTWGKVMAYTGGDISGDFNGDNTGSVQDFWCVRCDRGPASGDVTHYFAADLVYTVPRCENFGVLGSQMLGGWTVSTLLLATTGQPIQVTQPSPLVNSRPDIISLGEAVNDDWRSTLQYLNPGIFSRVPVGKLSLAPARPGNVGNHALRGPGSVAMDLSLGKEFPIPWITRERARLHVRVDFFNALNHSNYADPNTNLESNSFGRMTSTRGARVGQASARISW